MSRHGGRNPSSMPRASLPAFNPDQVARIRQGKLTACLISASGIPPKPDSIRALRRTFKRLDGDGNVTGGVLVERVTHQVDVDGEKIKSKTVLTIRTVSDALWLGQLLEPHALLCGHRTAAELEQAWLKVHPRTERVRMITFSVGDVRDRDFFMDRTGGYTLSPALSVDREAPAITPDAQAWITRNARDKDELRLARERRGRKVRSLLIRLREAEKREDWPELAALAQQLVDIGYDLKKAA